MQKPMRIVVNDHGVLTLPAYAILDNMLNVPERDYRTFEEMCSFFPKDEPSTVRNALTELKDEKYVMQGKKKREMTDLLLFVCPYFSGTVYSQNPFQGQSTAKGITH